MGDITEANVLQSEVILFLGTKGKGGSFTPDELYKVLGVPSRSPPLTFEEFRAFLQSMAERKLLRRWKLGVAGDQGEAYTGVYSSP